jgi:hypothetical protein
MTLHFSPLLSLALGILAGIIYLSTQAQIFYGLPWSKHPEDFWGIRSHRRKYKADTVHKTLIGDITKPSTEPRYFGSTTFLSWTTDWYHLGQAIWLKLFYLILANQSPWNLWISFFVIWTILGTYIWATGRFLKR